MVKLTSKYGIPGHVQVVWRLRPARGRFVVDPGVTSQCIFVSFPDKGVVLVIRFTYKVLLKCLKKFSVKYASLTKYS